MRVLMKMLSTWWRGPDENTAQSRAAVTVAELRNTIEAYEYGRISTPYTRAIVAQANEAEVRRYVEVIRLNRVVARQSRYIKRLKSRLQPKSVDVRVSLSDLGGTPDWIGSVPTDAQLAADINPPVPQVVFTPMLEVERHLIELAKTAEQVLSIPGVGHVAVSNAMEGELWLEHLEQLIELALNHERASTQAQR